MFMMSEYHEWDDGIMIEFLDDSDAAASFSINKKEKFVKITEPNKKGAFEWGVIDELVFIPSQEDSGELSIYFSDKDLPGTDNGALIIGKIDKNVWEKVVHNLMGKVNAKLIEILGLANINAQPTNSDISKSVEQENSSSTSNAS